MKAWHWSVALPLVILTGCNSSSGDNRTSPTDSLTSVSIISKPTDMITGDSMNLSAEAVWSSGKTEDITQSANWTVTAEVAQINDYTLTALKETESATLTLSYQSLYDEVTFVIRTEDKEIELTGLELSSYNPSMVVGETQTVSLTAKYSDGSDVDVTELAQWQSQGANVVQVEGGKLTAIGEGRADIVYDYQSLSDTLYVDIVDPVPVLDELEIRNHQPELIDGYSMTLEAWAYYSDDSSENITEQVAWLSSNEDIASFTQNVLNSHAEGEVELTIQYEEQTAQASVVILPAIAISILPNITNDNALVVTEDDVLSNTVTVELSNQKSETFDSAQFVFDSTAVDEQGYIMLEISEDSTRALRSGNTQFVLETNDETLQKRLDELGIVYDPSESSTTASATINLEVTDNPNIYQWNQVVVPDPDGLYLIQMFTQNDRVYFVWNSASSYTSSEGVFLSWFDGQDFSEPVKIIDYGYVKYSNHMINGGGNGYALVTIQTASNTYESHIVDLANLDETHLVNTDGFTNLNSTLTALSTRGAVAFDTSGNLIVVRRATMELTFHKYFPEDGSWLEAPQTLRAERIAQQLTHPDHLVIVQQETSPLEAPISFLFFNLSDYAVEVTVPLQYPQGTSEYCETSKTAYHLGLSLTQELEKFAVYCYGKVGTSSAPVLQRLLWEDATQTPFEYTPEETLSLEYSTIQPIVAHVGDQILANTGYTEDTSGKEFLNVDHLVDGELSLHTRTRPTDSHIFSHAYVDQSTSRNKVLDTSFLAMTNPYVEDEAVFIYQEGIAIVDTQNNTLSYDDALYGTKYWGGEGDYLFVLNGEWHMLTHSTSPTRQFKVVTFQMRNPEGLN